MPNVESIWELLWSNLANPAQECFKQLTEEEGIVLYNSTTNRVIEKSHLANVTIAKYIYGDRLKHCKVALKEKAVDHYYDFNQATIPLSIKPGKEHEVYRIGSAVKFAKDNSGNLTPFAGCKYVIANLNGDVKDAFDLTKLNVYELGDLQIDMVLMNNTLTQAIKVADKTPNYLLCLYDFKNKPESSLFTFQPKYKDAVKCYDTLKKANYHLWDIAHNKIAEQRDIQLAKINCGVTCIPKGQESYIDWCKKEFKATGFHSFYNLVEPLKIKAGTKDDTYSIGVAEKRISGVVTKVDGCKYVITGFKPDMKQMIDLSQLKEDKKNIEFKNLEFISIYMNDLPTVAVYVDSNQPKYLFCLYDHKEGLIEENFKFYLSHTEL